jgi:hypothetical protein
MCPSRWQLHYSIFNHGLAQRQYSRLVPHLLVIPPDHILTTYSAPGKRALVIGVNGVGNLAGVIGAQLFRSNYGPTYLVPLHATLGFVGFALVGYVAYRFTLRAVNNHRARKISMWSELDFENERLDDTRLGDKKYTFVYSL